MLSTLVGRSSSAPDLSTPMVADCAAAAIFDQHGAALLAVATVLTGDQQSAEAAVVEVIGVGFPLSTMAVPMPAAEMRRQLSRRIYNSCVPRPAEVRTRSDCDQIALALTSHGQLTYRAVADLLGLSAPEVALSLGVALRRGLQREIA